MLSRILVLVFSFALAVSAASPRIGLEFDAQATGPVIDAEGLDGVAGIGGHVALTLRHDFDDRFFARAGLGYVYTTWTEEADDSRIDFRSQYATVMAEGGWNVAPSCHFLAGVGLEIPVSASYDDDAGSGTLTGTKVAPLLEGGIGVNANANLSWNLKVRYTATNYAKDVRFVNLLLGINYDFDALQ